jgi:hypothetical protein
MKLSATTVHRLSLQTHSIVRVLALAILAAAPRAACGYDGDGPSPDMAAWEVFVGAVASSAEAGENQLEFETWASDDDLYGRSPPRWPSPAEPRGADACRGNVDLDAASAAGFPSGACIAEEVRRNWAAFRYLASHGLASKAGLAAAFEQRLDIDLPADAIQVKADWMKIGDLARWSHLGEDDVRRAYYTRVERHGDVDAEYALVALHLNSKRWTNLLWATFEHQRNPGRCDEIGCHDTFGATVAHVLSREPADQNYGACPKTPALTAIFANVGLSPVWLNYCLKGSQIAFKDKSNRPTLLGNSVIDRINGHIPMAHSSCMTCHALASFDAAGDANRAFADDAIGDVDLARLRGYLTDGFVWGAAKAR